jgi:hypothetical protein
MRVFAKKVDTVLEGKPCDQGALSRWAERGRSNGVDGVESSEPGNHQPAGAPCLRRLSVCRHGVRWFRPVENIGELDPNVQTDTLPDLKEPANTKIFSRTALVAIIVILGSGGAELADGRIGPGGRVQHKRI